MPIRRRITIPKRLSYHRLFGSIENPPSSAKFPDPLDQRRSLEWARGPSTDKTCKAFRFPRGMGSVPLERVLLGLIYHRHLGVGPGQGFSVWVCTNVVYDRVALHVPGYTGLELSGEPNLEFLAEFIPKEPYDRPEPCVYRPWAEMRLWYQAYAALTEAYEERHDVNLPIPWVPTREGQMWEADRKRSKEHERT